MGKNFSYFLFILWLCYLIVSSILLFTRGFLLTREVQTINSTCISYKDIPCPDAQNHKESRCTEEEKLQSILNNYNTASSICLPPQARVVLLIVDALRYDFTLFDGNIKDPLPFQNKLPVINKLINDNPNTSRLYKFIADPPTTTMQRLKALTTGSLPTFIDAGSNFATYEIGEDNIIDQILRNDYKTVFMGDDTWDGLYPNRFLRNYPYPSFNVWDLDTVDNGVRENLFPELKKKDWNLLVGHFLGVDHCGHRYGPNHPEMERKLGEINDVLENVIPQLDDDTMLFVIGDHGMTVTGDHGGETQDETNAAMFVYSKKPLISISNENETKQVNIVPTLSTILQVPIPFQNLGTIIIGSLPKNPSTTKDLPEWKTLLFSLWANVQQIYNYIEVYASNTNTFNEAILREFKQRYSVLNAKLRTLSSEDEFTEFSQEAVMFMVNLRDMCEEVWVQFDSYSMTRGLLFLFLSIFFVYVIADGIPLKVLPSLFVSSFVLVSYAVMLIAAVITCLLHHIQLVENLSNTILFSTCLVSQLMLALLIIQNWEVISLNWYARSQKERIPNLICRLVLLFNLFGLFSNSYIIEESSVLLFLLVTVILVGTLGISPRSTFENTVTRSRKNEKNDFFKSLQWSKLKLFFVALIIAGLVRGSMYFWKCRAEQQWCFAAPHEITNITSKVETTKLQWAITVIFLAIFVIVTKVWLSNCGNLNGYSITVTMVKFLPTVLVVCTAGYWVLNRLPTKRSHNLKSVTYLALSVYGLTFASIVTLLFKPLCTYMLPGKSDLSQNDVNLIPQLYRKIKGYFVEKKDGKVTGNEDVPVICGLGTAYSAVFVILGVYLTLLFSLLLGDAVAPSAVIMFMTAAFVLIITSVFRVENAESIESLFDIPNMSILIWIILSQYFFYASGHQPAFPNIAWDAAFVGTSGVFMHNFIPGALIIINTFCSFILMGVLLPLVLIAPFTVFVMVGTKKKELHQAAQRGEVVLFERDDLTTTSAFTLCCKYIIGHGVRVFASMLAATIHCRHLMVWNIFAPKLIFESIGMLVTLASVAIGYLILLRINGQIEKLIVKLNKMS